MKHKHNYSLKPAFLERMKELLPLRRDFGNYLKILKTPIGKSIRCNTLKISPIKLKEKLEDKDWKIKQPWRNYPEVMIVEGKLPAHSHSQIDEQQLNEKLFIKKSTAKKSGEADFEANQSRTTTSQNLQDLEPGELGRALEHLLGYYYIQEFTSMLPVIALKPMPKEIILDLCSSPGSKTTQIASLMKNTGTIIANEVSLKRIKILASNLEKCGVTNTIITRNNGIALCNKLKKENFKIDKILVDAPCSGEGTLRSKPKTYLMWNIKTVKQLSRLQKKLVASAVESLKSGGELVYSTCTHAPEENEEVVDFILKRFPNLKMQNISLPIKHREGITQWKNENFSNDVKKSARIYPHDNNTEGFFLAKFKKLK